MKKGMSTNLIKNFDIGIKVPQCRWRLICLVQDEVEADGSRLRVSEKVLRESNGGKPEVA